MPLRFLISSHRSLVFARALRFFPKTPAGPKPPILSDPALKLEVFATYPDVETPTTVGGAPDGSVYIGNDPRDSRLNTINPECTIVRYSSMGADRKEDGVRRQALLASRHGVARWLALCDPRSAPHAVQGHQRHRRCGCAGRPRHESRPAAARGAERSRRQRVHAGHGRIFLHQRGGQGGVSREGKRRLGGDALGRGNRAGAGRTAPISRCIPAALAIISRWIWTRWITLSPWIIRTMAMAGGRG